MNKEQEAEIKAIENATESILPAKYTPYITLGDIIINFFVWLVSIIKSCMCSPSPICPDSNVTTPGSSSQENVAGNFVNKTATLATDLNANNPVHILEPSRTAPKSENILETDSKTK